MKRQTRQGIGIAILGLGALLFLLAAAFSVAGDSSKATVVSLGMMASGIWLIFKK